MMYKSRVFWNQLLILLLLFVKIICRNKAMSKLQITQLLRNDRNLYLKQQNSHSPIQQNKNEKQRKIAENICYKETSPSRYPIVKNKKRIMSKDRAQNNTKIALTKLKKQILELNQFRQDTQNEVELLVSNFSYILELVAINIINYECQRMEKFMKTWKEQKQQFRIKDHQQNQLILSFKAKIQEQKQQIQSLKCQLLETKQSLFNQKCMTNQLAEAVTALKKQNQVLSTRKKCLNSEVMNHEKMFESHLKTTRSNLLDENKKKRVLKRMKSTQWGEKISSGSKCKQQAMAHLLSLDSLHTQFSKLKISIQQNKQQFLKKH